jgi:hypothetical protein
MLFVLAGWILFRAANFSTAASILGSTIGLHGSGGPFTGTLLILAAAAVSALLPSAHEIKDRWAQPSLAAAIAFGLLAAACVLDVGNGPPLSFIYFQF